MLLQCDQGEFANGCDGGLSSGAFEYAKDKGVMSVKDYPKHSDKCSFDQAKSVMKVDSWKAVAPGDEEEIQKIVYN